MLHCYLFVKQYFHYQKKKIKRRSIAEPKQKLSLNIGNIKDQFEKENISNESASPNAKPPIIQVNKLDKSIFTRNKSIEEAGKKKKEYVPVIIDKDAFERTKCAFEKEKIEEEERQNQIRYVKSVWCLLSRNGNV